MNALIPVNEKLIYWAEDTIKRIRLNMQTQRVYPYKPYDGSPEATRSLYNTLYWSVHANANGDQFKVHFFFNYYAFFVDAGVGGGSPYQRNNDRTVDYNQRYKEWPTRTTKSGERRGAGRVSRPFFTSEIRHQVRRLGLIMTNRYGIMAQAAILYGLSNPINKNSLLSFEMADIIGNERNLTRDSIAASIWSMNAGRMGGS